MAKNRFANLVDVAAGREIHHRVGAIVDGGVQLLQLFVDFEVTAELPMLALILQSEATPIAIGSSSGWLMFAGMIMRPRGHFVANELGRDLLFVRDERHFFGDHALAREVHLREVAVGVLLLAARKPFCARFRDGVAVAVRAIRGSHEIPNLVRIL